jgi:hypothetical protein
MERNSTKAEEDRVKCVVIGKEYWNLSYNSTGLREVRVSRKKNSKMMA